jgi:hypothetical protein
MEKVKIMGNVEIRILGHRKGRYQTFVLERPRGKEDSNLNPSKTQQNDERQHTT